MSLSIITVQLAVALPLALLRGKKIAIFLRESASQARIYKSLFAGEKKIFFNNFRAQFAKICLQLS